LIEANENRVLYVAIPDTILMKLMKNVIISKSIERIGMKLIVVNLETSKIVKWIN
jgi:XisH protein